MSTPSLTTVTASLAAQFTGEIGINTHMDFTWTSYSNFGQVENALSYLGIQTVRDSIDSPTDLATFTQLNKDLGVKFDLFVSPGSVGFDWQNQQMQAAAAQGIVKAVEGPIESDNFAQSYNGLTGMAATLAEQKALYTSFKSNAALSQVQVIQSSFGQLGSFANAGALSPYADAANAHVYFGTENNPGLANWIGTVDGLASSIAPGKPVDITETGYSTNPFDASSVDQTVQAKYTLDDLLDAYQAGAGMINLYELVDQQADSTGANTEDHFGLFNADFTAKPAAIAVHNMLAILNQSGATTVTSPGSLSYSLAGMPAGGNSQLFEKADGTFILALWNDTRLSGPYTQAEIAVAPAPVTLTLGRTYAYVDVFDPLTGTGPVQVANNTGTVTIELPDHPVFIELSNTALPSLVVGPSISAPTKILDVTGTRVTVDGLAVSDAATTNLSVTLSASTGSVAYTNAAGTMQSGLGVTITGSLLAVDAALSTVTYAPGTATATGVLTVTAVDDAGLSSIQTIALDNPAPAAVAVAPVPPAPTIPMTSITTTVSGTGTINTAASGPQLVLAGGKSVTAGGVDPLTGIAFYDKFASTNAGAMYFRISDSSGLLSATNSAGVVVAGSGTNSITLNARYADVQAVLASLTYTAVGPALADSIRFNAYDQVGASTNQYLAVAIAPGSVASPPVAPVIVPTNIAASVRTGGGNGSYSFASGVTDVSLTGIRSQYVTWTNGSNILYVADLIANRNGVTAITMAGGQGQVIFADGNAIGIGDIGDATEYTGPQNSIINVPLTGNLSVSTGGGTNTLVYGAAKDTTPDANWSIAEDANWDILATGDAATGYTGTATTRGFGFIELGSKTYQVEMMTPTGQQNFYAPYQTTAGVAGNILLDSKYNDSVTFGGSITNYWFANGGTDTATLASGSTKVILAGAASDYTETFDGISTVTITNTANKDGTGTKIISLAGGQGELLFGSGPSIALGGSMAGNTDTVQYGGSSLMLNGTSGNDTFYMGRNTAVNGTGGADTYWFGQGDGAGTIANAPNWGTSASGTLDLVPGVSDQNLWFQKSGANLVMDILGTKDQLTVTDWFANPAAQVTEITAGGLKLDTQLATLVQAMATYSAGNSAFNPQTSGTAAPHDTSLQTAIAAAWHS